MKQYLELMKSVMVFGNEKDDRTNVGTLSKFGTMMRFDLSKGFPAVTTKRLAWRAVVGELLWFLRGSTNVEVLREITYGKGSTKRTIWDDNFENQGKALGYEDGYLGPVYGKQWRNFGGVDQVSKLIHDLKNIPDSRRHIVCAWNPTELDKMALPPCHVLYQLDVYDGKLSLMWYQRSVDIFLGLPFNIASYALLTHILADICGLEVGELIFMGGDTHIYSNHVEQCKEQMNRVPRKLPTLQMPKISDLSELYTLSVDDFKLIDYNPCATIKAPMAV